ncbi:MAG: pilus assembly protein PilM, partial [Patescibacteria group bacterium]
MTFKSSTNSYLGINIGSSSIKIVELKNNNNKLNLLTYGFSENVFNENNDLHKSREYAIGILQEILKKAKIKSRNAVVSLPTSSIFSSIISLPNIEENEIALAVEAQAKKIIPLPIEEME